MTPQIDHVAEIKHSLSELGFAGLDEDDIAPRAERMGLHHVKPGRPLMTAAGSTHDQRHPWLTVVLAVAVVAALLGLADWLIQ